MQGPSHEVLQGLVPLLAIRHIEHHRFQKGNHIGTEGEVLVHPALRQAGKLRTLLHQLPGQFACLFALHQATHVVQPLDVRTQLLLELRIIRAIHRHLRTDFPFRYRTEVDTADRSVRQYIAEVRLSLADGGRCVPVEADAHPFAHARCTHTRLSIHVPRVESQAHNLEVRLLVGIRLERIKLVNLVHLRVEKTLIRIRQTLHEGRIRHIRINLLDDQPLRSLALVLVRPLRTHFRLPFPFSAKVLLIPLPDVLQDIVDRLTDAVLSRTRFSHQHVHQGRLVKHVVDVPEVRFPQVRGKSRKYRIRHGRLVNLRCTAHEELDERRQTFGHHRRNLGITLRLKF